MKKEDFIGVWKLVSYGNVVTSQTHLVVKENMLWEVDPDRVYYENKKGPEVGYIFEEGTPAKLSRHDGFKYLVEKRGERLFMKLGSSYGKFPESFADHGMLGEFVLEESSIAKTLENLPEKVAVEELRVRGLGTLKFDNNLDWWVTRAKFQGKQVKICISIEGDKFISFDKSKQTLKELEAFHFEQIAADRLLKLYNETWNESKKSISSEDFVKKVSVKSVTLETDGGAAIYLKDGKLFLGHSIEIFIDSNLEISNVGIV